MLDKRNEKGPLPYKPRRKQSMIIYAIQNYLLLVKKFRCAVGSKKALNYFKVDFIGNKKKNRSHKNLIVNLMYSIRNI